MKTESWIERAIIQQLTHHDRRYKYDYESRKESTIGFVVGCGYLETMVRGEDIQASFGEATEVEEELEPEVMEALRMLQQQDMITKTGERPRSGLFMQEDLGSTDVWELTDEGLKEASDLNEAYSMELDDFEKRHEELDIASANEFISISQKYGVVPEI
jgi:hypothetical protein